MSNDQKIMDKFVEQSQEILVLKDFNRRLIAENKTALELPEIYKQQCDLVIEQLNISIKNLESKLKIAVEALKTAENNACSCCDSNLAVDEHCQKAIKEMEAVNEKI